MSTQSTNNFSGSQANNTYSGMFKNLKMPKIDLESAIKTHKRNLEALSKAQSSWVDCAKTLNQKHTDYVKEHFSEARSHWQDMMSSKSFEEKVKAHSERVEKSF